MFPKSQPFCVFVDSLDKNEVDLYLRIAKARFEKCINSFASNLPIEENDLVILIQIFNLLDETFYKRNANDIYYMSRLGFRFISILSKKGMSPTLDQILI